MHVRLSSTRCVVRARYTDRDGLDEFLVSQVEYPLDPLVEVYEKTGACYSIFEVAEDEQHKVQVGAEVIVEEYIDTESNRHCISVRFPEES